MIFCGHCVYEWLIAAPALIVGGKHLYSKLRDTCSTEHVVTEREVEPRNTFLPGCSDCDEPREDELVWCRRCGHGSALHTPDCQYGDSGGPCLCGEFRGLGACTLPAQEPDVHTRHCCPECGCKYGEDMTCSVARGWKRADGRCEYCAYRERECRMCS